MVRGMEGCPIFLEDQDRQDFVSRISELVEKTGTKVLAWTLMDNHLHLLIISGSQGISKFMRRLLTGQKGNKGTLMKIITLRPLVIGVEGFYASASEIRRTWDTSPCDG